MFESAFLHLVNEKLFRCVLPDKDALLVGDLPGGEGGTVEVDLRGCTGGVGEDGLVALVCDWHDEGMGDEKWIGEEGADGECEKRDEKRDREQSTEHSFSYRDGGGDSHPPRMTLGKRPFTQRLQDGLPLCWVRLSYSRIHHLITVRERQSPRFLLHSRRSILRASIDATIHAGEPLQSCTKVDALRPRQRHTHPLLHVHPSKMTSWPTVCCCCYCSLTGSGGTGSFFLFLFFYFQPFSPLHSTPRLSTSFLSRHHIPPPSPSILF